MTTPRSAKNRRPVEQVEQPPAIDPESQYFNPSRRAVVELRDDGNPATNHEIEIIARGVTWGYIDARAVKVRAQRELESMAQLEDLFQWLQDHANVDPDDMPDLRAALDDMPLGAVKEVMQAMGAALATAIQVPNASRQPGSSQGNMTAPIRRGRR